MQRGQAGRRRFRSSRHTRLDGDGEETMVEFVVLSDSWGKVCNGGVVRRWRRWLRSSGRKVRAASPRSTLASKGGWTRHHERGRVVGGHDLERGRAAGDHDDHPRPPLHCPPSERRRCRNHVGIGVGHGMAVEDDSRDPIAFLKKFVRLFLSNLGTCLLYYCRLRAVF